MSDKDERHHFTISIRLRGAGADWDSALETVEVRAYNLRDALLAAAELPLADWFSLEGESAPKAIDEKAQREP